MLPQPAVRTSIRTDSIRQMPKAPSHPVGAEQNALAQSMQMMGAVMSFPRNSEIFGENEPADYVYGSSAAPCGPIRSSVTAAARSADFYLPGDIFGLEFADEHTFSAEAIADAKVVVVKRSAITALAGRDPTIGRELFALTGRELRRVQDRVLLLVKSAQERVASFLLEMAERASAGNIVELPMSRQISPTISASPSKPFPGRSRVSKAPLRSRCRPRAASCCGTVRRCPA